MGKAVLALLAGAYILMASAFAALLWRASAGWGAKWTVGVKASLVRLPDQDTRAQPPAITRTTSIATM